MCFKTLSLNIKIGQYGLPDTNQVRQTSKIIIYFYLTQVFFLILQDFLK